MNTSISDYNLQQSVEDQLLCNALASIFVAKLPEAEYKIWHGHPVWFLEGNPIVGYSKLKNGIRVLFWSGASFEEPQLKLGSGKFKDASITYTKLEQVNLEDMSRWLQKAIAIQWDYKNIVRRKGELIRYK